jgi:hypothetical protein
MAKTTLNAEAESAAHALIRAGHYDANSAWSFDAEDGNRLLGPKGDDWDNYARWHLGEDPSEPRETKAHWKYPYGKGGKVYRRAVAAIRSRASQAGDTTIYDAAGRLMDAMDDEDGKKESQMSGLRQAILGSRFGHFAPARRSDTPAAETAAAALAAAAEPEPEEDEEARGARAKAEEEEEMRKARRAKRARKTRRAAKDQNDDDDDDDAGDDDEDDGDDDEMRRAAAAGHSAALDAAFRRGARAQRRRCARIFEAPAAAANPALAASLAFETPMTADAAAALLARAPAAAPKQLLADRMAASGAAAIRVGPGAAEAPRGEAAIAASWDRALKAFAPAGR